MRLVIVALLMVPAAARGAGFAVAEQSAVAGGTAGAGTARASDPSAGWYNPAALADGHGWLAGFGVMAAAPAVTSQAPDGSWSSRTEPGVLTPPHIYLSHATGRHAWGIAVTIPYGAGVTWPEDWQGRHEVVSSSLEVARVAPFYAWRRDRLRLAAGLHMDFARLQVARKLDFVDTDGDVALDLDGSGLGVDAALYWDAAEGVAVGLSYKSRTYVAMSGDADFTVPDAFSEKAADQRARAAITLPDRIAAGVAWTRGDVTALADVELTLWGTYDRLVIDFEDMQTPDVTQVTDWHTTVAVRGGVEWLAARRLVARAGLFYDPSPAPAETLAPISPDSSRMGLTLGGGYAVAGKTTVDLFYEYLHLSSRESSGDESLAARYAGHAHILGVSVSYRP